MAVPEAPNLSVPTEAQQGQAEALTMWYAALEKGFVPVRIEGPDFYTFLASIAAKVEPPVEPLTIQSIVKATLVRWHEFDKNYH